MRKSIKTILGGAILVALPMLLTSCEGTLDDVFGEWSRPTPTDNSGSGSTPAASSNYMAWNGTALAAEAIPSDAKEVTTATTKFEGGIYVVKSDVTCNAINVTATSKLIIYDGAKLTVTGHIEDESGTGDFTLSIYGQENQTGQLIINGDNTNCLWVKNIELHGGDITLTATASGTDPRLSGLKTGNNLSIYGGKVKATGADADATNPGAAGIDCGGNLTIKGEAIVKAYGGAKSGSKKGGIGINVGGTIDITGNADVYCKGRGDHSLFAVGNIVLSATKVEAESPVADGDGSGIYTSGDITISGGTVIAASGENGDGINASNLVINGGTVTATSNSKDAIRVSTSINITTGVNKVEMINPSESSDPTGAQAYKFASTDGTITLGGVDTNYMTWYGYSVSGAIAAYPKLSYDGTTRTLTYNPN